MNICPECNRNIPLEDALFCPYCGNKLPELVRFCKKCGFRMKPGYRFCPMCGGFAQPEESKNKITKIPVTEEENSLSIHSWLGYGEDNIYKDYGEKRSDRFSYCLSDERANDLRIIKKYSVDPDTVYFVTADVKTENIVNHEGSETPIGACISTGNFCCSPSLFGTNDWQTLGVLGRSDENGNISVSFNLGYFFNTCSGTAWFENVCFTPADNYAGDENKWRFLAVLLTETSIDVVDAEEKRRIKLSHKMSAAEKSAIKKSLRGFEKDFNEDAEGLFSASVDIVESAVKCSDYTKTGAGYTITGPSAYAYLNEIGVDISSYDHVIMIACQPGLPVKYYGLGGLRIHGKIGFSFILHTDISNCIHYLNGKREGSWPSAIYVHEFLHSIESCSNSLGLPVPAVDGDRFGYPDEEEFRAWYKDFMHKRLTQNGETLGVDPRIWRLRPSAFPQ